MNTKLNPKVVSIGSISAASLLINAFKDQPEHITAIVSTTDTGSSTGIVRKKFSIPAPGDVRAVLSAMGNDKGNRALLRRLFEYRLKPEHFPELSNLALGNLLLAALTDMLGSFSGAIKVAGELLGIKGKVLPVTTANTHLKALLDDGREVRGEEEVRQIGKPPIQKLFLKDNAVRLGEGVSEAITEADLIVIGPGCLYTSIIACLVVPGLPDALQKTKAKKIYCCNTTTTPGQTDGLTVLDHVKVVIYYLDNNPPDYALINSTRPRREVEKIYGHDKVFPIVPTPDEVEKIKAMGCVPIVADLIEGHWEGKRTLHKLDTIRHDPRKVRRVLENILH
ncbi:MAG: gluconeogenesis factor YvcK family protein [Pseudomonadota bacterium]